MMQKFLKWGAIVFAMAMAGVEALMEKKQQEEFEALQDRVAKLESKNEA